MIAARGDDMVRSIFTCLVRLFKESGKIPVRQASGMILFDNDESKCRSGIYLNKNKKCLESR